MADPYAPYSSTNHDAGDSQPWAGGYGDAFNASSQALPLVSHANPFQRPDYEDEYDERKSLRSDDFDNRSRLTSHRDDEASNFGSESYAPSRNMFQAADKRGMMNKEPLAGEIMEGETTEVLKESSARRRWVALCWILTWWIPNFVLSGVGRMKRIDIRQAWREKLAINLLIWFICACTIFVIVFLHDIICPKEYVFSTNELASHNFNNDPGNVLVSIRGEVFDLTAIAERHYRTIGVIPTKSILQYGGKDANNLFPVQVSAFFFCSCLYVR